MEYERDCSTCPAKHPRRTPRLTHHDDQVPEARSCEKHRHLPPQSQLPSPSRHCPEMRSYLDHPVYHGASIGANRTQRARPSERSIMPQVALLAHDQGTASAGGAGIRPTACAGAGAHVESTRCRRVRVSPAVHAVARCCSPHRRRILARGAVCTKFEIHLSS